MFWAHTPLIRSIRCYVAAYGFLHCKGCVYSADGAVQLVLSSWGIHNNMQLEPGTETNSRINYLDLLITRNPTKFGISIFCKPTSADTTINFYSNHPLEHKITAYRFHIERMFALPLGEEQWQEEWESI